MVSCPLCAGTGRYSVTAGHPLWSKFFGGTGDAEVIQCPLCEGARKVADEDEDILLRHPLEIQSLINAAAKEALRKRKAEPEG